MDEKGQRRRTFLKCAAVTTAAAAAGPCLVLLPLNIDKMGNDFTKRHMGIDSTVNKVQEYDYAKEIRVFAKQSGIKESEIAANVYHEIHDYIQNLDFKLPYLTEAASAELLTAATYKSPPKDPSDLLPHIGKQFLKYCGSIIGGYVAGSVVDSTRVKRLEHSPDCSLLEKGYLEKTYGLDTEVSDKTRKIISKMIVDGHKLGIVKIAAATSGATVGVLIPNLYDLFREDEQNSEEPPTNDID